MEHPPAMVWPESDRPSATPPGDHTATSAAAEADHDDETDVTHSVLTVPSESEAHVDAADWARASQSVVGRGSLLRPAPGLEAAVPGASPEPIEVTEPVVAEEPAVVAAEPGDPEEPVVAEEPAVVEGPETIRELEPAIAEVDQPSFGPAQPLGPSPLAPATAPPPLAPLSPPPALSVWRVPAEQGPFVQPYQPPTGASSPVVTPLPPVAPPAAPMSQPPTPALEPPPVVPSPATQAPPPVILEDASLLPPPTPPPQPTLPRPGAAVPHPASATHACANCGLPLSAKARFCRRCGAAQPV